MLFLVVEEIGWCLDQYGCDAVGIRINGFDGHFSVAICLQKCWEYDNATGCEVVESEKMCSYHTGKLSKGNPDRKPGPGVRFYSCYIHKRGNLNSWKL